MEKKTLIIVIIISSLVVISSASVGIYFGVFHDAPNNQLHPDSDWEIIISGSLNGDSYNISINALLDMPSYNEDYVIQGSTTFTANYKGVSLTYLLQEIIDYSPTATSVKLIAYDDYFIVLTISELLSNDRIILAYEKNGEFLEGPDIGGNGYLRLIVPQSSPDDYNGPSCLKNVVELEIM